MRRKIINNWMIKQFYAACGLKGKISLLILLIFGSLTYPLWRIAKFDYFKLFFPFDVLVKNKDGIYFCKKRSWSIWYVSEGYEGELRDYFQINRGIFIDVGAHVGKYTIMVARRLKNKGMVIAVEPEKSNFQALIKNISLNKLKNVIPLNLALYSKITKLRLYLQPGVFAGGHSLYRHWIKSPTKKYQKVKAITLDYMVKKLRIKPRLIKLIKLDVEGAEADVLKGAKKTLKESKPAIIFESLNEKHLARCKNVLSTYGYKVFRISKNYFLAKK